MLSQRMELKSVNTLLGEMPRSTGMPTLILIGYSNLINGGIKWDLLAGVRDP